MDVSKVLAELRAERALMEEVIEELERIQNRRCARTQTDSGAPSPDGGAPPRHAFQTE